jgi:hypothetical protein
MTTTPNIDKHTHMSKRVALTKDSGDLWLIFATKYHYPPPYTVTNKFMNNRQRLANTLFYA